MMFIWTGGGIKKQWSNGRAEEGLNATQEASARRLFNQNNTISFRWTELDSQHKIVSLQSRNKFNDRSVALAAT